MERRTNQPRRDLTTGLTGLDRVLRGIIPGDNIVWNVGEVQDYQTFVTPCWREAVSRGQPVVYLRFAHHPPLVPDDQGVAVYHLSPDADFERFVTQVADIIDAVGRGGVYIFDCLSDLAGAWYSDQMLANFFMLTCPHLLAMEAMAYFGLLRAQHSLHTSAAIVRTAQVVLNVYRHQGGLYVHPWKVQQRHSPTMYMLHEWRDATPPAELPGTNPEFHPVAESATIADILSTAPWPGMNAFVPDLGLWSRAMASAASLLSGVTGPKPDEAGQVFQRMLRMLLSRDPRVLELLEKHLTLADVVEVGHRVIGSGLIGGKAVGMLLARSILHSHDPRWGELLEAHDSFFVGSDVYYTYLVDNGIWWLRRRVESGELQDNAEEARHRMLSGRFPDHVLAQFQSMLDYYGQSPIIVRSSSLLEDNFGNAFAGKYESIFCANQGPRERRLENFLSAVRTVYASAMSAPALAYRAKRGLLGQNEQMALLVQRVSGVQYGDLFYPQIAGVGFSFNPYVWSEYIDPKAGMVRLVLGLGTRAVERSDDDYTRVVALNAPTRRPEVSFDQKRQYAQRRVDVLDLEANQLMSTRLAELLRRSPGLPIDQFATRDANAPPREPSAFAQRESDWVLTFEPLLGNTPFVADLRQMFSTLEQAYAYPVDLEFTLNLLGNGRYKMDLVQCRPLQVKDGENIIDPPAELATEDIVLEARGAVIGQSRQSEVDRLVYVVPGVYGQLPQADRYSVARLIGRLLHTSSAAGTAGCQMLVGPGRWGTSSPSLGVPVSFADIDTVSVLCEVVAMNESLVPDVSLGTHFLNELVEMDILYLALFPQRDQNLLNESLLARAPNRLPEILPDAARWAHVLWVIDGRDLAPGKVMKLNANVLNQKVVCYLENSEQSAVGSGQ